MSNQVYVVTLGHINSDENEPDYGNVYGVYSDLENAEYAALNREDDWIVSIENNCGEHYVWKKKEGATEKFAEIQRFNIE